MTPVYRAVHEHGDVHIVGCDKNGHQFRIPIDPGDAFRLAAELDQAATRAFAGRRVREQREAFDDTATREPIEHSS